MLHEQPFESTPRASHVFSLLRPAAIAGLALLFLSGDSMNAQATRPMTIDDLYRLRRVSDPDVSPDGSRIAYVLSSVDLDANKVTSQIWIVSTEGGPPRRLTNSLKKDRHPRFSPDGKRLLFESDRGGETQLWIIDIDGGEARPLTTLCTGAETGIWSPDGQSIAFVSSVFPEFSHLPFSESDAANRKRSKEAEENPVKAKVISRLFFRHWDEWVDGKRRHLLVIPAEGGTPRDVTPGDRDAYPTSTTFSGGDDFVFSPDSSHLIYTAVPERNEAWNTNYDLYRVPIAGGTPECLTSENLAADGVPRFSPDGSRMAYRAQRTPGYEADRWELVILPTSPSGQPQGAPLYPTRDLDQSIDEFVWLDDRSLAFTSEKQGRRVVSILSLDAGLSSLREAPLEWGSIGSISASVKASVLVGLQTAMSQPAEVVVYRRDGNILAGPTNVSQANTQALAEFDMRRPESVTVAGAEGTPMQMWILTPPGFDPAKKWPVAFIVHGGPQGASMDDWSYRWNFQLWAQQGYVVALPNPRGSTGFGQKYVDEISGDWGGKCFHDLMGGADYLESLPYVDRNRMAAAGASFGGYMMNWFAGHTDRFRTLISHCGVYNFESMYATTDELWFDEWEHGGPPWGENRESYERHSPHRFARNFRVPMLVIHGDQDFRVPVSEAYQLFTTLQRLGVESKLIEFPDEGHWISKPANGRFWHREVFTWLARFAEPGGK